MPSLKEQLAALEGSRSPSLDPEDEALDSLAIPAARTEGREHYAETIATARQKEARSQAVLGQLGQKYGGKRVDRRKIFDDDDDEEDEETEEGSEAGPSGSQDDEDEDDEQGEQSEDGDEDEDAEGEEDDEEDEAEQSAEQPAPPPSTASKALDPVAALRDTRQKDIEKGRAVKRQKVRLSPLPFAVS